MAISGAIKRQFPRFATPDLICRFRIEGSFQWDDSQMMNLSKGGVCIKAKAPPPKGVIVELELNLQTPVDGWKKRKMKARVMWCRGKRSGLHFLTDESN